MHSFHLVTLPPVRTARVLGRGLGAVDGLRHAEPMATMRLGAPVVSPERTDEEGNIVPERVED